MVNSLRLTILLNSPLTCVAKFTIHDLQNGKVNGQYSIRCTCQFFMGLIF